MQKLYTWQTVRHRNSTYINTRMTGLLHEIGITCLLNITARCVTAVPTCAKEKLCVPKSSRKVAGSIPDGVIGIFHWHNPSGRTIALGLTQPLTEMSTRNISWGADNLTIFMCRLSWNLGASTSWNPQGLSRPRNGIALPFTCPSMTWWWSDCKTMNSVQWTAVIYLHHLNNCHNM